ncbi:MAG: DUF1772 domain-containing protein [Kineosporiaceae bacterium]
MVEVEPSPVLVVLLVLAAVGAATSGGVLFAFSSFVMPALARLEPPAGAAAMQAINVTAVRPSFMSVYFGTGLVAVLAAVVAAVQGVALLVTVLGAAVYLVGVLGVTVALNVPLNDRLAAVSPDDAAASGFWVTYRQRWTAANHVRAVAAAVSAALLALSLVGA